jgi:transposase
MDESGMDNREDYEYGYNEKGKRYYALRPGKRTGRVNMLAALCTSQLLAPFTVNGSCTREVFEVWLKKCLVPVLKAGQVVILDNARFHKGGRIRELIEQAGCRLMYLPAYSPDLNKIENCWSWLKSRIRKRIKDYENLRSAMEAVLKEVS